MFGVLGDLNWIGVPSFRRPLPYAAISGSYNIVGSLIVSAILLAI